MRSPLDRVRLRLEAFRRTDAALRVGLLMGAETADAAADARRARAALGTGENRADLDEARSLGLLAPEAEPLLVRHLADAAHAEALARVGAPPAVPLGAAVRLEGREETLGALASEACSGPSARTVPRVRAIAGVLDRDRAARREALDAAEEAAAKVVARAEAAPDDAPSDLAGRCATFLAATDERTAELRARVLHARGLGAEEESTALLLALAVAGRGGPWRPRLHSPAVSGLLRPLGLEGALARGVRLSSHHLATVAAPLVTPPEHTAQVHVGAIDLGVLSRVLVVEGCVRGLALALAPSSLPFERRVASAGSSLSRALGATLGSALVEPVVLSRSHDLDARDARSEAAVVALALLLLARVRATRALAVRARPNDEEARLLGARALGLREPLASPEVGHASTESRAEIDAAARASLVGLAAAAALRERFDQDWARNPRVEPVLRAASHHGVALSAERWLAEIGGRPEDALGFGRELAGA